MFENVIHVFCLIGLFDLKLLPLSVLGDATNLLQRQRSEKNAVCASAVENWSTALRSPGATAAIVVFAHFFLLFLYNNYVN